MPMTNTELLIRLAQSGKKTAIDQLWSCYGDAILSAAVSQASFRQSDFSYRGLSSVERRRAIMGVPIVYLVYNHILPEKNGDDFAYSSDYLLCKDAVEAYISRAILFKYYSNATTNKLAKLKNEMNKSRYNGYPRLTMQILDSNPDLRVTEDQFAFVIRICRKPRNSQFHAFGRFTHATTICTSFPSPFIMESWTSLIMSLKD